MRHNSQGQQGRRPRHRGGNGGGGHRHGGGGGGGQNRMQVFDSNGPDVRIRGTAYQICEKYLALAKDAAAMGDRVVAESYLQHAEHYQRLINTWQSSQPVPSHQQYNVAEGGEQPAVASGTTPAHAAKPVEDLGLPASIVGAPVTQGALEDA